MPEEDDDDRLYEVVINDEEQYSIWFAEREPPPGWRKVGSSGRKQECLAYVDEVWTDMRPLSLRKRMESERWQGTRARRPVEHTDGSA